MALDSIVAEVRQAREESARRFDYDLRAMIQDAKQRQVAGGRRVVTLPPRPVMTSTRTPSPNPPLQQTELASGLSDG